MVILHCVKIRRVYCITLAVVISHCLLYCIFCVQVCLKVYTVLCGTHNFLPTVHHLLNQEGKNPITFSSQCLPTMSQAFCIYDFINHFLSSNRPNVRKVTCFYCIHLAFCMAVGLRKLCMGFPQKISVLSI